MRLLQLGVDGEFGLVEYDDKNIPRYAILSHTWGEDHEEVTFQDLKTYSGKSKAGYGKLNFCANQAAHDGLRFFWVDTCCIDKSSSAELAESINCMFRWYSNADRCYVYLANVSMGQGFGSANGPSFYNSRWFTRGWTLQELVAPKHVEFFSVEGEKLGDKSSLVENISKITGISSEALQGTPLTEFSIDERMSWAKGRKTKREEDEAYCLLGIFGVSIPPIYGEGRDSAMHRLLDEIEKRARRARIHSPRLLSDTTPPEGGLTDSRLNVLNTTQDRMQTQLLEITEALAALTNNIERGTSADITGIVGSATEASISISHICSFIHDLYKYYSVSDQNNSARFSNARWLEDNFNDIWADVQYEAASQLRNKRKRRNSSTAGPLNFRGGGEVRTPVLSVVLQHDIGQKLVSLSRKRKAAVRNNSIDVNLPIGSVRMFFTVHRQSGKIFGARLVYIPARHMQSNISGFFATCLRNRKVQTLSRSISTFRIIREGSEALEHIQRGDLQATRYCLASRQIHPNDRDEDGDSLLLIALLERQYQVCELLLQEGANPMDCDSDGKSVLCCFLDQLYGFSDFFEAQPSDHLSPSVTEFALRLFIRYCGVDTVKTLHHHTDLGHHVGEYATPIIQQAMCVFPDMAKEIFLFLPIRQLLANGSSIEETDGFGRSALLASVEGVKRSHFVELANLLLQFGAVPSAVDNGNAGMFHYIFRTATACNKAHAQQDLFQPIEDLLKIFLSSECNPNAVDEDGYTPSDLALSPSAWVLWCNALDAVGLDPHEIILKDDQLKGIKFSPAYIERKYRDVLTSQPASWIVATEQSHQTGEDVPVCQYCEFSDDWTSSRFPFDAWGSYFVKMGDSWTHAAFINHRDGTFCANGRSWSSCRRRSHRYDGEITHWSYRALYLRKHIALQMWKNGILSDPQTAYGWATGLSVHWEPSLTC